MAAAQRFFFAMAANGEPDKFAMDKSVANKAAIDANNTGRDVQILVRQVKYLNNIVEQCHRAIERVTSPMLKFKSFRAAHCVLAGFELMHMIRKGQFAMNGTDGMSFADQFMPSRAKSVLLEGQCTMPDKFGSLINNAPYMDALNLPRNKSMMRRWGKRRLSTVFTQPPPDFQTSPHYFLMGTTLDGIAITGIVNLLSRDNEL